MLYLYFIENLEAVQPTEVPHLIDNDLDVLSEKALHKVATTLGDRLSDQTSLNAPVQSDTITYNEVKTTQNEPFTTFIFYYRSTDALKSIGIIPRTPSPSPELESEAEAGDKDLTTITPEELREELKRLRNKRQEAVRIKRERQKGRDDSEATLVGDDDVEWVGTVGWNSGLEQGLRSGAQRGCAIALAPMMRW